MTMLSPSLLTYLQWTITLSGVIAFWLSVWSWRAAYDEIEALKAARLNGALWAAARLHLITATNRLVAASLSMGGGVALTMMPDFVVSSGVLAGVMWLLYSWLMTLNPATEMWARRKMQRAA
jgi:hypothetical protein